MPQTNVFFRREDHGHFLQEKKALQLHISEQALAVDLTCFSLWNLKASLPSAVFKGIPHQVAQQQHCWPRPGGEGWSWSLRSLPASLTLLHPSRVTHHIQLSIQQPILELTQTQNVLEPRYASIPFVYSLLASPLSILFG